MREQGDGTGALRSRTLMLGEPEWRALLRIASTETNREGRPVSVSEIARRLLRQAAEDQAA